MDHSTIPLGVEEIRAHRFVAEASTLGFRPGQWPRLIETNLGNGRPFFFHSMCHSDGEIISAEYRQALGCITLSVLND